MACRPVQSEVPSGIRMRLNHLLLAISRRGLQRWPCMVQEPIPLHQVVVELLGAVVSARLGCLLDEVLVVAGQGVHRGETGGAGVH